MRSIKLLFLFAAILHASGFGRAAAPLPPVISTARFDNTRTGWNIGFGSYGDNHPWHGWIFAYSASTLSQVAVFCVSPNGYGGALWQSGAGPAVDASGNLYVFTGNGTYDGATEWGQTILKLSSTLSVLDWFTPANYAALNDSDLDLGSGTTMLMPGTKYVFGSGKDSRAIIADTTNMGHLQGGGGGGPVQIFSFGGSDLLYGGAAFPGSTAFFQGTTDSGSNENLFSLSWTGAAFSTEPTTAPNSYGFPGAQYAGSSDGMANGILWMQNCTSCNSDPSSPPTGFLAALNPVTLAEIYNSNNSGSDALGTFGKFTPPVVANGRVYVASQSSGIVVYGLK
jgi:hypothetical protein